MSIYFLLVVIFIHMQDYSKDIIKEEINFQKNFQKYFIPPLRGSQKPFYTRLVFNEPIKNERTLTFIHRIEQNSRIEPKKINLNYKSKRSTRLLSWKFNTLNQSGNGGTNAPHIFKVSPKWLFHIDFEWLRSRDWKS